MIEQLTIRGFQCHRKLSLKLSPTVTTIIGPSDAGKSAILRALKWVCMNTPRGKAFIHWSGTRAQVTLKLTNHRITRTRGKSNTYHLDGSKFTAFSNNVPDEVANVLQLSDLNFQGQLDSPFWFGLTPGEVSKRLNSIVDLGTIDSTLSNLSTSLRRSRTELDVVASRVEEAETACKSLSHIPVLDSELQEIEKLQKRLLEKGQRCSSLRSLLQKGSELAQSIQRLAERTLGSQAVLAEGDQWAVRRAEAHLLRDVIHRLKRIPVFSLEGMTEDFSYLEKKATRLRDVELDVERVCKLIEIHEIEHNKMLKANQSIVRQERRLEKEMSGPCPLCGRYAEDSPIPF